jgi:hypothetical protein
MIAKRVRTFGIVALDYGADPAGRIARDFGHFLSAATLRKQPEDVELRAFDRVRRAVITTRQLGRVQMRR